MENIKIKIVVGLFLLVVSMFLLTGCSLLETAAQQDYRFIRINKNIWDITSTEQAQLFYDVETNVEYIYTHEGGFEMIRNADGTPYLYKEDE